VASEAAEGICYGCKNKQYTKEVASVRQAERDAYESILLTTETNPDLKIAKRLEIISAECVFGMNLFRDFFAGVRDIFGGRSKATQKVLRDARRKVLEELRAEAHEIGATAVIAIRLDYSEISGDGKSMLFVVATGTAVVLASP
jgi:uncharacterized protein YbjQ (UPF0145 family)